MSDTTATPSAPATPAPFTSTPLDTVFGPASTGDPSPSPTPTPDPAPVEPPAAEPPAPPSDPPTPPAPDTPPATPDPPAAAAAPPAPPAWESDDNPYKKRHADTARWTNEVHKQNLDLKHQLDVINKKLDGTYDPATDVPPAPSIDEVRETAATHGKVAASIAAARDQFGKDADGIYFIDKLVFSDNSPYARLEASNPAIKARVMASDAPALEAMQVVREHLFFDKYGRDPDQIIANLRKEITAALRDSIRQEEVAKLQARLTLRDQHPTGLGEHATGTVPPKPTAPTRTALDQIFT